MKSSPVRLLLPLWVAGASVFASLTRPLLAADLSAPRAAYPIPPSAGIFPAADSGPSSHPGGAALLTESQLRSRLPGKTLIRIPAGEFHRVAARHASGGRVVTGPALAALLAGRAAADGDAGDKPGSEAAGSAEAGPDSQAVRFACVDADTLRRQACLDSLARAQGTGDSSRSSSQAGAPKALREIEDARDAAGTGPGADEGAKGGALPASATPDEVYQERTRGYVGQLLVDIGSGDSDSDMDNGDWAVIFYVVVGVVVVGAFVLGGGKALYDLVVNKEEAPVFKEAGLRFSYSGLSMPGADGSVLYRDAYLAGARLAIGVERDVASLGLALEGGSINLTVGGLDASAGVLDFRGGYLVGGPMVRFGSYRPLALTMEFLNGTSTHGSIGLISKARMMLATRTRSGLVLGGHMGAVFYDLKLSDGLVFRRGDLNRDLSLVFGVDAGWAF